MTTPQNLIQELETLAAAGDLLAHRTLGLYWAGMIDFEITEDKETGESKRQMNVGILHKISKVVNTFCIG